MNCIGHATSDEIGEAIDRWRRGAPFVATEARIDNECLGRLFEALNAEDERSLAAPLMADRRPSFPGEANFERAVFTGHADFHGVTFRGPAYFDGALFEGRADFRRTEFLEHADFDGATFNESASFRGAIFSDHVGFQRAHVVGEGAGFAAAKFRSYVDFEGAVFGGYLELTEATFQLARRLGPFGVGTALRIDGCVFSERVAIEVRAERLSAKSAVFPEGARVLVLDADVDLEGVDFGRASTLTSLPEAEAALSGAPLGGTQGPRRARLLTVQGAQIASLSLSGLDIRDCRFFGAHGLESLNVEPSCRWRHTPRRWRCIHREMIVEEQVWRSRSAADRRTPLSRRLAVRLWGPEPRNGNTEDGGQLKPMQLAALYRALRKAKEDNKDRAGASDLYYGEMEMRRLAPLPGGRGCVRAISDRLVITMYWLLSGYGLRAIRAFVTLALVVLAGAFLFWLFGVTPEPSIPRALLFSFESACSFVRVAHLPRGYELRGSGEVVQVALRVVGPLLLGLWLLALRSRVRR